MSSYAALSLLISVSLGASPAQPAPRVDLRYLHNLADFTGTVPLTWPTLNWDPSGKELLVTSGGLARVFNGVGLESFQFGDDPALGSVQMAAAMEDGDLLVLSIIKGRPALLRCTFRGELEQQIALSGTPDGFGGLRFDKLRYRDGHVYLVDTGAMKVLVAEASGAVTAAYDLAALLGVGAKRADHGLRGFNVDVHGNLLFTVPTLVKAYVLSPDGDLQAFGSPGSTAGRFNVVSGIDVDSKGNIFLTDVLRASVLVFDRHFQLLGEFGLRGWGPGGLVAPDELLVVGDRLYVTQSASRGVSVYKILNPEAGG